MKLFAVIAVIALYSDGHGHGHTQQLAFVIDMDSAGVHL